MLDMVVEALPVADAKMKMIHKERFVLVKRSDTKIKLLRMQPRSYNIETTDGVVLRNHQHLLKDLSAEL